MKNNNNNRAGRENLSKLIQRFDGIEDNNPPTNTNNGKKTGILYTSDYIDKLSYPSLLISKYENIIITIDKLRREGEWQFKIVFSFRNFPSADYAENLIHTNDFFTIKKILDLGPGVTIYNNEVLGYVKNIITSNPIISAGTKTVGYTLDCVITKGDPYSIRIGDNFIWSRDEFIDDINALKNSPIKLEALKINPINAVLTWIDETCLATSFILKFRKNGSFEAGDIYYENTGYLAPTNIDGIKGNVLSYLLDFSSIGLLPGEWQWSIASIFNDSQKDFSMWSNETLILIK